MDTVQATSLAAAFISLIIATYTDIRTKEVPDFLSYMTIAAGFFLGILSSIYYQDWAFIIASFAGFAVCFAIGMFMFYTGQWGGGDSKLIMGIGALLGVNFPMEGIPILGLFLICSIIAGGLYGLIFTFVISVKNGRKVFNEFIRISGRPSIRKLRIIALAFGFVSAASSFLFYPDAEFTMLFLAGIAFILLYYIFIFIQAFEKACMHKLVAPSKLTEGDWIASDVYYKGKVIAGPKDLGIELQQISALKKLYREKKIGKVLVKEGIPFVPSFLIGLALAFFIWSNKLAFPF